MPTDPILDYRDPPVRPTLNPAPVAVTAHQLAVVGCRLVSLWLFAQVVELGASVVYLVVKAVAGSTIGGAPPSRADLIDAGVSLAVMTGPIAAGAFLWARSDWLARRMVAGDGDAVALSAGPGYGGLLSIGLAMVGAAVAVPAARDLASAIVVVARARSTFAAWWHDGYWLRHFWSAVVGLALAAWLLFGSRGIVRAVIWARTAGHPIEPLPPHSQTD